MKSSISPELVDRHRRVLRRYLWSRRESIRQVPELVSRGANNAIYRIRIAGRPIIAKIGMNPFYRQLHTEYAVLCSTGAVSPEAIDFYDDSRFGLQVLLLEQIAGAHPYTLDDTLLCRTAETIASYHRHSTAGEEVPRECGKSFIHDRLLKVNHYHDEHQCHTRFHRLYQMVLTCADKPEFVPDEDRMVLVHGDLVPRNIIVGSSGNVRVIDWEGARYDVPEADLATLVKAYRIEGKRRELFFSAYGLPVDRDVFKFRLVVHFLQVIAWRLAVQLPREQGEEYAAVTNELEEELTAAEELAGRW